MLNCGKSRIVVHEVVYSRGCQIKPVIYIPGFFCLLGIGQPSGGATPSSSSKFCTSKMESTTNSNTANMSNTTTQRPWTRKEGEGL